MIKNIIANKKLLADIILIAVLLVVGISVLLVANLTKEEGDMVVVSVDGRIVAEYPLSLDATYYLNNGTNVLVIEDGCAYMREANCPGYQDCVETGKIRYVGQSITCLPNHIVVEIVGEGEGVDI